MGPGVAGPVAPLGRRSAAYLLDSLVVSLVYLLLGVIFDAAFGPLVAATPDGSALVVVSVNPVRVALELTATLLVDGLYFAGSWTRWAATPAQRVLRLRVRSASGPAPDPGGPDGLPAEAAWRRWAVLAVLPIAIGSLAASGAIDLGLVFVVNGAWFSFLLLSAAADPLRRGLHDRVAGTIVVTAPGRRA